MRKIGIGIIGCGNISDAYLKAAPGFPVLEMIGVADINSSAAEAKAAAYGLSAMPLEALLADHGIEIILNLTTPQNHVQVGLQAVAHGKHVYCEKPLATTLADAERLISAARNENVRVGCAPDTFLGGSHQTARRLIDDGAIGTVVAGSAFMQVPGHELWHPNPDFYYKPGGGPLMDMGPYYLTCLVNLLGPVKSVVGHANLRMKPGRSVPAPGKLRGSTSRSRHMSPDCWNSQAALPYRSPPASMSGNMITIISSSMARPVR
ncbi:Gfo/Idh/MocA family oxidoreductase [Pararhizobium sp. A13]|uniref:Gfo/Idh/MocA family protein n=1 Tax=Pararhizobium sp. A13 TaxID=3133975 RepID=UPI00311B3910